jgi:hypothetical protein
MGRPARPGAHPPADLVDELSTIVAAEGGAWFPDLGDTGLSVRFHSGATRARCYLYRFEVGTATSSRPVAVKVRHSQAELRRTERHDDRPVLAPVRTVSDHDEARREYQGLQLIRDAVSDDTDRFGVVRPLAWLPRHPGFVTDYVDQPTLRTVLLSTSRAHPWTRGRLGDAPWENAGAWLRRFHDHPSAQALPAPVSTAPEVGDRYRRYADFLQARIGRRSVLDELRSCGPALAESALPAQLPLRTGHGDFVATNLFTTPTGRITGFDPLPLWRLPVYQDLATLVIGLRVLPVQAAAQGFAFDRQRLATYEAALLRGYFGEEPVPRPAVQAFQLLVLLDRWSARVALRSRREGARRRFQEAGVRLTSRHYEAEARGLLARLGATS